MNINTMNVIVFMFMTTKAGVDYAAQSGTLRSAAGETKKTFAISILDDGLVEGDETLSVILSNPTGGAALGLQKTARLTPCSRMAK